MTDENYKKYEKIQKIQQGEQIIYNKKQYPRNTTLRDRKIIDSRHSKRLPLLTRKIFILGMSIILVLLIFSKMYNDNRSFLILYNSIFVFILLFIPVFYTMKKVYYFILLYIILFSILGGLGYGWGIFGLILTINPFKKKTPKNPSGMKTSAGNPSV